MNRRLSVAMLAVLSAFTAVSVPAAEIQGKVTQVNGEMLLIQIEGNLRPNVGDKVHITRRLAGVDQQASVADAEVILLQDRVAVTKVVRKSAAVIREGYLATITSEHPAPQESPPVKVPVQLPKPTPQPHPNAGQLLTARSGAKATRLANGKVLLVGGAAKEDTLASAELFDPANGTWSPAGAMATPRSIQAQILLDDGKVLVAGGLHGGRPLASAELYDPTSNTWSSAGSMATARYYVTATLLYTRKVLVAGGYNGSALASAELYDPTSNTWSSGGVMATGRYAETATVVDANAWQILFAGGYDTTHLSSAQLYDVNGNRWSSVGPLPGPRAYHTAIRLDNDKVLLMGGTDGKFALSSTVLYDPATRTFTASGPGSLASQSATAGGGNDELSTRWRIADQAGPIEWELTPLGGGRYNAKQFGGINATGTAALERNHLRIDWTMPGGGATGFFEFDLESGRIAGKGKSVSVTGLFAGATYPASITRIGDTSRPFRPTSSEPTKPIETKPVETKPIDTKPIAQLLPTTAGAIVLAYNLPGVDNLKLTREAYVGIFLGKIMHWNDPAIADANPGVKLPDRQISVVIRADESGTTYVFTRHLSAISEEFAQKLGVNKQPNWPVGTKAIGNEGIAASIKSTPGSIGYLECGYVKNEK